MGNQPSVDWGHSVAETDMNSEFIMLYSTIHTRTRSIRMKFRQLGAILGIKGVLCIISMTMIVLAFVVYTVSLVITPTLQFTTGATSSSWTVYINDVNKARYLPGGMAEPTFNASDPNSYAFMVVTDANQVCAVKIELTSAVNASKFSNFNITIEYWNNVAWVSGTLYSAATGSTTKSYINGLTAGDFGYVHQDLSTTRYYLIKVTYSYDKVGETTQVASTFQFTPLPQNSF
jgi:hypothetical protein